MEEAPVASEFPARIGNVARRALTERGITTYTELTRHRRAELLAIHGIGPKSIRILGEELADRGLAFADDRAEEPPRA